MPNATRVPDPIVRRARQLIARYGTRDPFAIARQLGVEVMHAESFGPLKGMYRVIKGVRFIFLNADNSPEMNRMVCAHELGHDQLHRAYAQTGVLRELSLTDMTVRPEYEANLFAAELLLDDDTVLSLANEGYSTEKIAALTACDRNLVALKIDSLIHAGHNLRPQNHDTQFFASVKD